MSEEEITVEGIKLVAHQAFALAASGQERRFNAAAMLGVSQGLHDKGLTVMVQKGFSPDLILDVVEACIVAKLIPNAPRYF